MRSFAVDVVIEATGGQTGRDDEISHRGSAISLLRENPRGYVHDLLLFAGYFARRAGLVAVVPSCAARGSRAPSDDRRRQRRRTLLERTAAQRTVGALVTASAST